MTAGASPFEQVVDFGNLLDSARRAARGKRARPEVAAFLMDLEPHLLALQDELIDGSYQPGGYRTFTVRDPKPRTISAAPFRDRVVHHAICAVLEPIAERTAIGDSYACRQGKGVRAAIRRAQVFARRDPYFMKLDVRRFYETADHGVLRRLVARRVPDPRLIELIGGVIDAGAPGSPAGQGLPIGSLTSQHLANLYLSLLDHHIKAHLRVRGYCRYMDDMLLFAPDRPTLWRWHRAIDAFVTDRLHLELKAEATRVAPVADGVPYLGFRIWPAQIRLDGRRARRLRRRLRSVERRRAAGALDDAAAARSAASLIGWAGHADTGAFLRTFFDRHDARGLA